MKAAAGWSLAVVLVLACASGGADVTPGPATGVVAYLLSPVATWTASLEPEVARQLATAYRGLVEKGDSEAARRAALLAIEEGEEPPPASLLAAQADFVEGRLLSARRRLEPWIEEHPRYTAARLLEARLAELSRDWLVAHAAYRELADELPVARRRLEQTREEALAAVERELGHALERGRVEEAARWVEQLERWAPEGSQRALAARARWARAADEPQAELEALRALHEVGRREQDVVERLADLELRAGDPEVAIALLQGLFERAPDDEQLRSKLASALAGWRLRLLPDHVQRIAERMQVSRGDFAALFYWLVPGVRAGAAGSARIATDVLEHPRRREIVRVLNLGLMRVDRRTHRFQPDRPLQVSEALESLLRLLQSGRGQSCAEALELHPAPSDSFLCDLARECDLLERREACLPRATVSGQEALALLGRALWVLEAGEGSDR